METSAGMALFGQLINLPDAGDGSAKQTRFEAINKGWVMITRPWHLLTESSGVGNPSKASIEKGEKYLSVVIERTSKFIKELSDAQIDCNFPF
jgi:creatinine amidohydrolase